MNYIFQQIRSLLLENLDYHGKEVIDCGLLNYDVIESCRW